MEEVRSRISYDVRMKGVKVRVTTGKVERFSCIEQKRGGNEVRETWALRRRKRPCTFVGLSCTVKTSYTSILSHRVKHSNEQIAVHDFQATSVIPTHCCFLHVCNDCIRESAIAPSIYKINDAPHTFDVANVNSVVESEFSVMADEGVLVSHMKLLSITGSGDVRIKTAQPTVTVIIPLLACYAILGTNDRASRFSCNTLCKYHMTLPTTVLLVLYWAKTSCSSLQ